MVYLPAGPWVAQELSHLPTLPGLGAQPRWAEKEEILDKAKNMAQHILKEQHLVRSLDAQDLVTCQSPRQCSSATPLSKISQLTSAYECRPRDSRLYSPFCADRTLVQVDELSEAPDESAESERQLDTEQNLDSKLEEAEQLEEDLESLGKSSPHSTRQSALHCE